MKHKRFAAVVLAAALLLAGCGGTQSSPSAAADQSSDSSRSTPGAVAQAAQTDRITDQFTLEKNVSGVWGEEAVQCISVHVPKLECDSPDAAYINDELNAIYAADFREFENSEEAGQPGGEYPQIGVGWDDCWYGDCVSLVVRSRYGGTAPWRYSGWCFDFATGRQITTAEMLQRMGLDPDEVQAQVQRQAMQAFDREMAQGAYYEGLRLGGEFSQMRMDTLEYNELENLCLLLPEQDQLVLRGKTATRPKQAGSSWISKCRSRCPAADTPVLTDTYDACRCSWKERRPPSPETPRQRPTNGETSASGSEQEHATPSLALITSMWTCASAAGRIGLPPGGLSADQRRRGGVCGRAALPHVRQRHDLSGPHLLCQQRCGAGTLRQRGEPAPGGWLCAGTGAPVGRVERAGDPYSVTGSYNYTSETGWNWMDLGSDGSVQLGVQDNSRIYRGDARIWALCPRAWCWASLPIRSSNLWRRSRWTCTTRT